MFLWTPGDGIDASALARLRTHFPRPAEPMGEAWFMGSQRRMFPALQGKLDEVPTQELQDALGEIASGTSSFGRKAEWDEWYHYLLGALLPCHHDGFVSYLLEPLLTGFMAIHPNGIHQAPYAGFEDDVLRTLGRCMMDGQGWNGTDIAVGKLLHRSNDNPNRVWGWADASGDFSGSMFFCLKYLPDDAVEPWLRSVFDIPSPHWRAQVMVWLIGAHDLLDGSVQWPAGLPEGASPNVQWEWSHCLRADMASAVDDGKASTRPFIPAARCAIVRRLVQTYFTDRRIQAWWDGIQTNPDLASELNALPDSFHARHVR